MRWKTNLKKFTLIYTTFSEYLKGKISLFIFSCGLQQRAAYIQHGRCGEGALIAIWGGRNLLDAGGSHFIVELLGVPLRYDPVPSSPLFLLFISSTCALS